MPLKHNYHWQQHGLLKCIIQPLLLSRKSAAKAYRYSIITVSISYWRVEKEKKVFFICPFDARGIIRTVKNYVRS